MQNAPREHSAILLTFIKLPFVINIFVLSIFEWPFDTGFTVSVTCLQGYKAFFMLNSTEHGIYPAHKFISRINSPY